MSANNLRTTRVSKHVAGARHRVVASGHRAHLQLDDELVRAGKLLPPPDSVNSALARVQSRLNLGPPKPRTQRYTILRKIGAGGCGQVFLAYDAELDRKVALKKMLRRHRDEYSEQLLHEARLLAKLRHENIVTVYDIQDIASATGNTSQYIIMEYVEGCSLREWLTQEKRSQREILRVLHEAGRGLAAAHDAGVIHRDFKPQNVIIDRAGQARVLDFGLSQASGSFAEEMAQTRDESPEASATNITGTPAYMAPERYFNSDGSVASDVFSFGVTLWEALAGERPFSGSTVREVQFKIIDGQLAQPPKEIPRRLVHVLRRCLATDPDARWPAMAPLLAALASDPWPRRRRWAGGFSLAAGAALAGSLLGGTQSLQVPVCDAREGGSAEFWNPARADRLRVHVLASGAPFSQSIWERIDARLASYAGEIQASATQACEDAQQQYTSITLTDRRLACLHAREVDLDAYVESLATGDQTAVAHAIQGLEALTPVASCATEVLIGERVVPPANATLAADVASLRTDLARIKAMSYAGRGQEVAPLADSALARAKSLGYQPVIAEAHLRRAHLAESRQEFERAEPDYQQAWWAAMKSAEDVVAREAANHLASMFSGDPKRFHEARTWSDNAEAVA
ncbi:MAG: serine/threonine-protein kinase, partial [Nannocystaceae bacterium]